jgi:hypothetical protein
MAGTRKKRTRKTIPQDRTQATETLTEAAQGTERATTNNNRRKRPVRRSESVVEEMLWRVAGDGRSLRQVCKDPDMPAYQNVYRWLNDDPDLRERYELARAERGEQLGERVVELSEQIVRGELDPQAGKNAIDGYKWAAGRMAPKAWGDRSQLDMNVRNDSAEDHIAAIQELTARKDRNRKAERIEPVAAEVWTEDEADQEDVPDDATRH